MIGSISHLPPAAEVVNFDHTSGATWNYASCVLRDESHVPRVAVVSESSTKISLGGNSALKENF
jgi:hypothetical protein